MVDSSLIELIPLVRRARDYHLYDASGNRYLDLFLNYGRAITGHRPPAYSLAWKNILSKGLYSGYASPYRKRLEKILKQLFSGFSRISLFENRQEAEAMCGSFADPLRESEAEKLVWRPFLAIPDSCQHLLVLAPGPFVGGTAAVLSHSDQFSGNPFLSAVQLGSDLCLFEQYVNWLYKKPEHYWLKSPFFKQNGPYLVSTLEKEEYRIFFKKALSEGFIFSPGHDLPSLVPFAMSEYEVSQLSKRLGEE